MKAIDRIIKYLEFKGIAPTRFEKDAGMSNGYLGTQLKRKGGLGEEVLMNIIDNCLDINPEWLLTGNGSMLKTESIEIFQIPLYDSVATAGNLAQIMSPISEPVEYINAGDWFRDATAAMRIHGDSMSPEYLSGSIVALKEVNNTNLLLYGQDYVIETSEFRVLKRIQKGKSNSTILACSANQDTWNDGGNDILIHEPFEINRNDITRWLLALGNVRRNHSSRIVYNNSKKKS